MTTNYEAELREQPESLARLLRDGRQGVEQIVATVSARAPRFAVVAARGSSDNAARYGQYLLGIENSLIAALATPSVFSHYGARPSLDGALVIGISQSGESPDIVGVVEEGRRQGAVTLALTNEPDSPLAQAANLVLPLLAGPERAVAATKTYTAQLVAMAMLSAALRGSEAAWQELARVPDLIGAALDLNRATVAAAGDFSAENRMIVVGRGYNLSTAMEIALKVKEMSGVSADGYSSADFLHGPKALLDRSCPVLSVAPGRRVFEDLDEVARLAAQWEAPFAIVSDDPERLRAARLGIPLPPGIPEWLTPIVAVVPGQLFAMGASLARGRNPDAPPGLSKVTLTR